MINPPLGVTVSHTNFLLTNQMTHGCVSFLHKKSNPERAKVAGKKPALNRKKPGSASCWREREGAEWQELKYSIHANTLFANANYAAVQRGNYSEVKNKHKERHILIVLLFEHPMSELLQRLGFICHNSTVMFP